MINKLLTGDVLHCTSNGVLGKSIRTLTKSEFNHTAFVIVIEDITFVIEAQGNGVNLKTYDSWIKEYNYSYILHRYKYHNAEYGKFVRARALSKTGVTGYDIGSLTVFQPVYLLTNKWIGRTKEDAENRFYCSEFVAWVIGIEEFWKYNPDMLYKLLNNDPHWQKKVFISDTLSVK